MFLGSVSRDGPLGPSPELLASLQSLGENSDYTLLPHSLHQIAEAYSLKEDYQWAIQFLQLEKLYHERLLSNLAALQENWGIACICFSQLCKILVIKHLHAIRLKCWSMSQYFPYPTVQTGPSPLVATEDVNVTRGKHSFSVSLCLLQISSPDGLVSILKRRRASLDGLPPPSDIAIKQSSKRKVRFSEPEDGIEQDEVGGDSCLILLLLCLVTVVISIGGTALYCTLVDTYSNICTDFTQNVNFYVMNARRFFEGLGHWLPLRT
uniref:Consortin, connexin sorting protein b n=1 Tax=Seriola dumerili TaxID=41447 RepID=A0A3B4TQD1_SERDU